MSPLSSNLSSSLSSPSQSSAEDTCYYTFSESSGSTEHTEGNFSKEVTNWIAAEDARRTGLEEFWAALHYDSALFSQLAFSETLNPSVDFGKIASILSNSTRQECGLAAEQEILFFDVKSTKLRGHPRDTSADPDFIACNASISAGTEVQWAEVSAVVEIYSDRARDGHHAIAYTLQLLQARPDLTCAQGMHVGDDGITLILASSDGVILSPVLNIAASPHAQLLYAFIKRLYDPHLMMLDPTIQRRRDASTGQYTFDITLTSPDGRSVVKCLGYSIIAAHRTIGERSQVFCNTDSPALIDGVPVPVIKDHYRERDNHFEETQILRHIHASSPFPGVVEVVYSADPVVRPDKTPVYSGALRKIRLGFRQFGNRFMSLKTPLEVLTAVYDLLEVTRALHATRKVLHRDISDSNVLCMSEPEIYQTPLSGSADATSPPYEMCFMRHILDENVHPLSTNMLLIDFDQGEILGSKEDHDVTPRNGGTRRFRARGVSGVHLPGHNVIYAAPDSLVSFAQKVYERLLPLRLARFDNSPEYHRLPDEHWSEGNSRPSLRHDAESAFWLLLWWAVEARASTSPVTYISAYSWHMLTNTHSNEHVRGLLRDDALDPAYKALERLLTKLGRHLFIDAEWATEAPFNNPDYVHELLQRSILNFVIQNKDKPFMHLPTAPQPRVYRPQSTDISLFELKRSGITLTYDRPTKRLKA
ncbi:hypothetical protein D9619_011924 [Psilocybe cf. subviscida]|uniref:Fungal-type protein kinase domain-containing protein n=1 Tax=Psilocybe cf. subviscida TaxID=2480587 RepID=A0A8H5B0H9_9AGAR|nr:hypothetical protein D9619_011924 [Psilocybe cf. subviscida]